MGARGGAKNRNETKEGAPIPPLGADYKSGWALWQLSLVLAEIADRDRLPESAEPRKEDEITGSEPRPASKITSQAYREDGGFQKVLQRKPGRPKAIPMALIPKVLSLYQQGLGYRAIARELRREGLSVDWSTIRRLIKTQRGETPKK